ncbi:MAG TPA: right-handed parallel beta-helix repeat-containing protein [Bryobacteraceae bacterium]|nr:right-handed parallel beta-helix repeat-containing protein [Bryobacteraceae bacterium]
MKFRPYLYFLLAFSSFSVWASAQTWSGILAPSRAINWSRAGIPGGLPSANWTQCGSTIPAGSSSATINSALANCAPNHYVQLASGTFNLSSGINWNKSNVALRGMGADQTLLVFSGSSSCYGLGASVGICSTDGTYANGPPAQVYNWTAGYAPGSTQITLSSTNGITPNQTMVMLDQDDDGYVGASASGTSVDSGSYFVCSDQYATRPSGCGSEGGTNSYRPHRAQIQMVIPTAVSGNVLTINSPGIYAPNWRSSQSPQAWLVQPIINSGIENVSVDATNTGSNGVLIFNGYQCWVSGVTFVRTGKSGVFLFQTAHSLIQNNYIYQSQDSDPYGIQFEISADNLVANNIIQQNRSPIVLNGPDTGSVFAYNFTILNQAGSNGNWSFWNHSSGIAYDLWEGNVAAGFADDDIHGSHNMITRFRNYFTGHESGNTGQVNPIFEGAYNRYSNLIGNVLGTSGFDNLVQEVSFDTSTAIFVLGAGNPGTSPAVPSDPLVIATAMRWGNYDTVDGAVQWVVSEVPSNIGSYGNSVPSSTALPPSFFLTSAPSWWPAGKPWPSIGPDITGGNIANVGGHAYTIPAQDCYLNVMKGPSDGSGGVLTFNASACYPSSGSSQPLAPPTNLTLSVH